MKEAVAFIISLALFSALFVLLDVVVFGMRGLDFIYGG